MLKRKSDKRLIILIITKDDPKKLYRILLSVEKNNFLPNSEILVIDNSKKESSRIENRRSISKVRKNKIIHVDKLCWMKIKEVIVKDLKEKRIIKILKDIKLGTTGWDINHARNATAIICRILYDSGNLVICFDDDMIISKKFSFNKDEIAYPTGIPLMGSPDLSRLEWIRLYIRFLNKKDGIDTGDYIAKLIKKLESKKIKNIIKKYTNMIKGSPLNAVYWENPLREELNAGSLISPIQNISSEIYPSWFDNDWFWFSRDRKRNGYPLKFISNSIIHLSSKKDVFDKEMLKFEEIGKIITTILKDKSKGHIPSNDEIKNEIKRRKSLIQKEIALSKIILSEINKLEKRETLLKIILNLEYLYNFLDTIKLLVVKKQIILYEKSSYHWHNSLSKINKENYIKQELFRILNRREALIFSPHCDDLIFSVGGIIQNKYLHKVKSYTVYSKSSYCLKKQKVKTDISKIRRNEEFKALRKLKIKPNLFGFNDSTLREYASEEDYLSNKNNPKEDSSFTRIRNKILKIVKDQQDNILIFPLGLGYNIDHTILFEIGKELIKKNYLVLFYEDAGYDMTKKDNSINFYLKNKMPFLVCRTLLFNNFQDKLDLCKVYKTQVSMTLLNDIKEIAIKKGGERIWSTKEVFNILHL